MPPRRNRHSKARFGPLSLDELSDLTCEVEFTGPRPWLRWQSDEERRAAYEEFRDQLLAGFVDGPMAPPAAALEYEADPALLARLEAYRAQWSEDPRMEQ